MGQEPVISPDVLARYAGDAAAEVTGVSALARAVEVANSDDAIDLTVHVELEWGRSASEIGRKVQRRVRDYVESMTNTKVGAVEVVIERVTAPPASR